MMSGGSVVNEESKKSNSEESRGKFESRARGIFSIETNWYVEESGWGDETSIEPILRLLRNGWWKVPFVSRDAATTGELFHYIDKWANMKKFQEEHFPILYLGFHGSEQGKLWLETESGKQNMAHVEVLQSHLEGKCKGRIIHFAGCSIIKDMDTKQFLESTQAVAVSGYSEDIDTDSYAFEFIYLQYLQYFGGDSMTNTVAETVRNYLRNNRDVNAFRQLGNYFGFEMHILGKPNGRNAANF